MKPGCLIALFFVMLAAGTLANLIALKIAATQASAELDALRANSSLLSLLGRL
jgi:hypothetical protein